MENNMTEHERLIIIDCGAKNVVPLARRIRGWGIYCEVISGSAQSGEIIAESLRGVIIACGINGAGPQRINAETANILRSGVLVFGIGAAAKDIINSCGAELSLYIDDWDERNDPDNEECEDRVKTLRKFLFEVCKFSGDWNMAAYANDTVVRLRERVGDGKAILALSGGLDSTVSAILMNKAIGDRLYCILVDHGLLRKGEAEMVETVCKEQFKINMTRIDASQRFIRRLSGVADPEMKRKIIGEEFIRVFEEAAKKIGGVDYFVQGTIYLDVIESGAANSQFVKTHHNVGGLPENIGFKDIVEPLRLLFKEEVRQIGLTLGLPEDIVWRQPFPGPGLGVRVLGEITPERLSVLREADAIFREEITAAGLSRKISQYFAALTNMRSVGVKGGARSYENVIALRALRTDDFMTAEVVQIPYEVLERTVNRITNEVPGVNRVVYDITPKPPATIEWE